MNQSLRMKNQSIKSLAMLTVAGSLVASCSLIKDLNYTVTPSPLEMHGDSVRVKVDVTFPAKGLNKKASIEITPMLGNNALNSVLVIGEKATGNGTTILYKPGGLVTYEDIIAYKPDMENADLTVSGRVMKGGIEKMMTPSKKIAEGTIITPLLVNKDFKVASEKDKHVNVREEVFTAQVNYLKGKSDLQAGELDKESLKAFEKWLTEAQNNSKIKIKSIQIIGYASPEGEENKNNTLSTDRANTGKTTAMLLAKNAKNEAAQKEIYSLMGRGEDYEGFKVELEKSAMNQDEKQLVIRVLEMYKDPVQRETEMRNMAKTFTYLDQTIFPKLRRAEIKVTYETTGHSDELYLIIAKTNPEKLGVEELLYAASIQKDMSEKALIYAACEKLYPTDYRAFNNAGVLLFTQGKLAEAEAKFEKANSIKENGVSINNIAAVAGAKGDFKKAKELLAKASGAGVEGNYNKGIVAIVEGNYANAVSNFGDNKTFNKALAQVLNKDFDGAIATINASADANSAQGNYLKAIAYAHMDKADECVKALQASIAKDASFKVKAKKDKEFMKLAANENFAAILK
jgi:tetratricopeptide (TPR) repeat protein